VCREHGYGDDDRNDQRQCRGEPRCADEYPLKDFVVESRVLSRRYRRFDIFGGDLDSRRGKVFLIGLVLGNRLVLTFRFGDGWIVRDIDSTRCGPVVVVGIWTSTTGID